jgi:hypothetical protein
MMDEITLEEVNARVKKHIQAKNLQIAMVTSDAKGLADAIAVGRPEPGRVPQGRDEVRRDPRGGRDHRALAARDPGVERDDRPGRVDVRGRGGEDGRPLTRGLRATSRGA